MSGYRRFLPDPEVLISQLDVPGVTFEKVGARYGVSRQAVHKAIKRYREEQKKAPVGA